MPRPSHSLITNKLSNKRTTNTGLLSETNHSEKVCKQHNHTCKITSKEGSTISKTVGRSNNKPTSIVGSNKTSHGKKELGLRPISAKGTESRKSGSDEKKSFAELKLIQERQQLLKGLNYILISIYIYRSDIVMNLNSIRAVAHIMCILITQS